MTGGEEKTGDFYAVLGLNKECSESELRNAYKKLAMRWHPDRCSAPGNSNTMDESKNKFQTIQQAYSVLSDSNKRFLYDVGAYDSDDDENGMGDFLGEMAQMMSQTKPSGNGHESFEDLQQLFVDLFQTDLDAGFGGSPASGGGGRDRATSSSSASPPPLFYCNNKRGNSAMNSAGRTNLHDLGTGHAAFCFGSNNQGETSSKGRGSSNSNSNSKRRNGRKQKVSSKHDVSSCNTQIST